MIYFDNAATTKINEEVLKSFNEIMTSYFANPASNHKLGLQANNLEDTAREKISKIFNCEKEEIIFTSGATESNNLAIKGTAFKYKNRGNHLITTLGEHPSVMNAFKQLEEFGFKVTYLPLNNNGKINIDDLKKALSDDTILVSVMSVNNEVGSINEIEEIGKLLKNYPKIIFHVDATQSIGKININYQDVDLVSMSSHKIHGFKGSGLLIKKKKVDLMPIASGGGQEFGLRSGTNNFPYEICLAKTLRIAYENLFSNYDYVKNLNEYLRNKLKEIEGVKINSPIDASPYILNFSINKKASVVSEALSLKEIYVSTKSACSSKKRPYSYVLLNMGKTMEEATNAIRLSFDKSNTLLEADEFIKELKDILNNIK